VPLILLTREGCGLCDEFAAELALLAERLPLPPWNMVNIDSDTELERRYGLKIPVLLWDGVPIAITHFNSQEIERLLRTREPV